MSGKWTKGPWRISPNESVRRPNLILGSTDAIVATTEWDMEIMEFDDEESANANLMAAAPELYDALDDLLNCGGIHSRKAGDKPSKAVWNAMQVLAKARGEQQ